jgi:hypothetical protein
MNDKGKPSKVTILHCGCTDAGDVMEYVEIQVSSKSRGHLRHEAGSFASCYVESQDMEVDFLRLGGDCVVEDESGEYGLPDCGGDQVPMAKCGEPTMGVSG